MQALQLVAPQTFRYVDVPPPAIAQGDVLVRLDYLTICGSDLKFYDRVLPPDQYPFPVGRPCHECVGTVEESTDPNFQPGELVLALTHYGGLFERIAISADSLVKLPTTEMDPALWVFCQPMGTVMYAVQRLGSVLGKTVVVIGQGPIGLCFTDLLVRHGAAKVIVTDLHENRLDVARRLGATHTINAAHEDVLARVSEITKGSLADVSIEACGLAETYRDAFQTIRKLGTVMIFGVPHVEDTFPFEWGTVYKKLPDVIVANSSQAGERTRTAGFCVDLVAQGRLDLSYLLTHRFTWEETPLAYQMYSTQKDKMVKGIVTVH